MAINLLITENVLSLVKSSARVGYLNAILAKRGQEFKTSLSSKVQMPGALPGGERDVDVSN